MADDIQVRFGATTAPAIADIDRLKRSLASVGPEARRGLDIGPQAGQRLTDLASQAQRTGASFQTMNRSGLEAHRSFASMASSATLAATGIRSVAAALGVGFGVSAIASSVNQMTELGERTLNMSAALGIGVQKYSEFGAVMKMAGGSVESASRAILQLEQNIKAALDDPTSKQRDTFAQLGFSGPQLEAAKNDMVGFFGLLGEKWRGMSQDAERSTTFSELFGRRGVAEMAKYLEQDAAAVKEIVDHARRVGAVLDKGVATNLDQMGDKIQKIGVTLEGTKIKMLEALRDPINEALDSLNKYIERLDAVSPARAVIKGLERGVTGVGNDIAAGQKVAADAGIAFRSLWNRFDTWLKENSGTRLFEKFGVGGARGGTGDILRERSGLPPSQSPSEAATRPGLAGTGFPSLPLSRSPSEAATRPGVDEVPRALALIARHESGNRPLIGWGNTDLSGYPLSETGFPAWPGKMGPKGLSTAAGLYQITRSTWDPIARQHGISDFSEQSQTAVASELYRTRGFQPWAPHNPALAGAIAGTPVASLPVATPAGDTRGSAEKLKALLAEWDTQLAQLNQKVQTGDQAAFEAWATLNQKKSTLLEQFASQDQKTRDAGRKVVDENVPKQSEAEIRARQELHDAKVRFSQMSFAQRQEEAAAVQSIADYQLRYELATIEELVAARRVGAQAGIAAEVELTRRAGDEAQKRLADLKAFAPNPLAQRGIERQQLGQGIQTAETVADLGRRSREAVRAEMDSFVQPIKSAIVSGFQGVITGRTTPLQAVSSVGEAALGAGLSKIGDKLFDKVIGPVIEPLFSSILGGSKDAIAGQTLATSVQTAGTSFATTIQGAAANFAATVSGSGGGAGAVRGLGNVPNAGLPGRTGGASLSTLERTSMLGQPGGMASIAQQQQAAATSLKGAGLSIQSVTPTLGLAGGGLMAAGALLGGPVGEGLMYAGAVLTAAATALQIASFISKLPGFSQGGIVPSAAGGWSLPRFPGATPALLHQREMVLPAHISDGIQNAIAGGGFGGGGAPVQFVFNGPADAPSMDRWYKGLASRHGPDSIRKMLRSNGLTPRSF